jgi:hypothetical protein
MIRLLFVGDGERDAATNPHLVGRLVSSPIEPRAIPWPRLNQAGRGYDRKLLFALHQAREEGLDGVVATIDQDKSPGRDRLRSMESARVRHRETAAPLPTALGCADPHAEAWLLDDPVAVRMALRLDTHAPIPTVRKTKNPKGEIDALHAGSARSSESIRTVLVDIARSLDPARCQHARETGFEHFTKEVKDEIGPLARAS